MRRSAGRIRSVAPMSRRWEQIQSACVPPSTCARCVIVGQHRIHSTSNHSRSHTHGPPGQDHPGSPLKQSAATPATAATAVRRASQSICRLSMLTQYYSGLTALLTPRQTPPGSRAENGRFSNVTCGQQNMRSSDESSPRLGFPVPILLLFATPAADADGSPSADPPMPTTAAPAPANAVLRRKPRRLCHSARVTECHRDCT